VERGWGGAMAENHADKLCSEHEENLKLREDFGQGLCNVVNTLLNVADITSIVLEHRVKSVESLRGKITRPGKENKYERLEDVTDLTGLRIVLFTQEDCLRAGSVIRENFKIDEGNSVDKSMELDPDRFGYRSNHLVISYSSQRLRLPDFKPFRGMKAEIQIRTALQHAWAAIEWRLNYKSKNDAPSELRRNLYRLSALLEVADDQFSSLETQAKNLRTEYKSKIGSGIVGVELNHDSVLEFLGHDSLWIRVIERFQKAGLFPEEGGASKYERISSLISFLLHFGYNNTKDIRGMLRGVRAANVKKVVRIVEEWAKIQNTDVTISPEGLMRLIILVVSNPDEAVKFVQSQPFMRSLQVAILRTIEKG
jgi:putative GTP pyrophosphokinase